MSADPTPANTKSPGPGTEVKTAPLKAEALPITEPLLEESSTLKIAKAPALAKPDKALAKDLPPAPAEEDVSTVRIKKPAPVAEVPPKAEAAPVVAPAPVATKPLEKIAIVIDDEPANRDFLVRLIGQANYVAKGAASGQEAIRLVEELEGAPMVIVIDSELPDTSGMELLRRFRGQHPQTKIIMATMHDSPTLIHQAFAEGCNAFVVKPHGFMELFKRLQLLPTDSSVLEKIVFDRYGVREFKGSN